MKLLVSIALLAALASPCLAEDDIDIMDSAFEYYSQCSSTATPNHTDVQVVKCQSYSAGLLDGIGMANVTACQATGHYAYLEPHHTQYGQQMMVVIKYMADHPTELNQQTSVVFAHALKNAYPAK